MRVPMLPLLLNSAMDSILKARYDKYRTSGEFPPEAKALADQGMRPFPDLEKLNDWRENINALKVVDEIIKSREEDSSFDDKMLSLSEYHSPHPMYLSYWTQVKQEINNLL